MSQTLLDPLVTGPDTSGSWVVVIFNNATNSQEEVLDVLMEATGCDLQEAIIEVWEAEHFGKSSVHFSNQQTCLEVAKMISSIGVKTTVELEWQA